MVREWGLSPRLGPIGFSSDGPAYLGEAGFTSRPYAEDTQRTIDEEVSRLLREAEARATDLLTTHRSALDRVIELLIEREVISATSCWPPSAKPRRRPLVLRNRPAELATSTGQDGPPFELVEPTPDAVWFPYPQRVIEAVPTDRTGSTDGLRLPFAGFLVVLRSKCEGGKTSSPGAPTRGLRLPNIVDVLRAHRTPLCLDRNGTPSDSPDKIEIRRRLTP